MTDRQETLSERGPKPGHGDACGIDVCLTCYLESEVQLQRDELERRGRVVDAAGAWMEATIGTGWTIADPHTIALVSAVDRYRQEGVHVN